jgi:monofunctional glycosyltransferase
VLALYLFLFPDVSKLKKENPKKTSFMKYREKEWQREGKKYRIQQKWVPLSRVSPYLIKAVLIAEDDKFWKHEGFDYEAMQKAIEKDIKAKQFKLGGSTISQQVAKNLYLSPSKNPLRKIREAIITWRMEKILSKRRILELYLNIAEWGEGGIFGIETAARRYYGKSAAEISPEEAARLASVLPNPRKFNPLGNSRYVMHRSHLIYSIMVRRGIVVPEYEEVTEEGNKEDKSTQGPSEGLPMVSPQTQAPQNQ